MFGFVFQYDEHLAQLEGKISIAQERALQDDDTWMGGDEENYTIAEPDRSVRYLWLV